MKLPSAAAFAALALLAALLCVPFSAGVKQQPELFWLEAEITSPRGGRVQVYFDSGQGFSEAQTAAQPIPGGAAAARVRLPIPAGTYQRLRFDPLDHDAAATVSRLQVTSRSGEVLRTLPFASLLPANGIASLDEGPAGLRVTPLAGTNDPQLLVSLAPPLELVVSWRVWLPEDGKRFLAVFAVLALAFTALSSWMAGGVAGGVRRPRPTSGSPNSAAVVLLAAVLSVAASSYPIIFLGKSLVSPNLGTVLLYEQYPTVPGYSDPTAGEVMGADIGAIMWQHVPQSVVQASSWRRGEVPVWNRYNTAGTPLLGQGQSMVGDPLHAIVLAANGASWAWDLKYLVAKALFALGLGFLVLTVVGRQVDDRRLDPPRLDPARIAAVLVTVAAPFIGFFVYRVNHPAYFSLCYAPWPLYCWIRATQSASTRVAIAWLGGLVLANLALMNSGTAKEAYMLLLTMNLSGAVVLVAAPLTWRARLTRFALAVWAGLVFALLTAPITGTFLHELKHAYTSYNAVSAYQIQPSLLLGFFDELFYRPLMPDQRTFNPSLNLLLLLGCLLFAATLRWQLRHRIVAALAAVSLLPLALAFGVIPPEWITRVPFLGNVVHIDNTFSCALIVLWTVLAGAGFARACERLAEPEGRGDLFVAAVLGLGLVFAWIAFGHAIHRPIYGTAFTVNHGHSLHVAPFIWGYLAVTLLAVVVLALTARVLLRRRRLTAGLGLLGVACLAVLLWRHGLQPPGVGFEPYVVKPTTRVPFQGRSEAVALVQAGQESGPSRAFGIRGNFFPGWTAAYQLETIHGPDALMNARYRELVGAMPGVQRLWDWRLYLEPQQVPTAQPYLDFLNVRYYLDLHSDQALMGKTLKLVKPADLDVYESPTVWPRAFFTDRLGTYGTVEELLRLVGRAAGQPLAAVHPSDHRVERSEGQLSADLASRTVVPATGYQLTENATAFRLRAPRAGVAVLTEAFWSGNVRVFVNGEKTRPFRVNHAFIGVTLPQAGDYQVEVRYVPSGWYRNLALFAVGGVLAAGTAAGVIWSRRRERQTVRSTPAAPTRSSLR